MPVSLKVYALASGTTCLTHGDDFQPVFALVIEVGEDQASMGPMCSHCLLGRVHDLRIMDSTPKSGALTSAKRIKKLSKKQERVTAEIADGRAQPGSGSRPGYKGDVRSYDKHRIENKFTFNKSFSLQKEMLDKIRMECEGRERPALFLDFKDRTTGKTTDTWVMIPVSDWKKLNAAPED